MAFNLHQLRQPLSNFSLERHLDRALAPVANAKTYLAAFGAAYIAVKGIQMLTCFGRGFCSYVLAGTLKCGVDLRKVGEWAVITGASDGIGKEFAHQLAAKGMNIVLVARNAEKTEQVANEIRSTYNVLAKVVIIDLAHMKPTDVTDLQEQLRPLRIALLINNAGLYPETDRFLGSPPTDEKTMEVANVNMVSYLMVTRAVLPLFLAQEKGYIINISSMLGEKPVVGEALYGATKTFVDYFSQALDLEYRGRGVRVQSVAAGLVSTRLLTDELKKNPFCADAPSFCANTLNLIGVRSRHHGHWKHALMSHLAKPMPAFFMLRKCK